MTDKNEQPHTTAERKKTKEEQGKRLAKALRDNLRRRKKTRANDRASKN